MNADHRQVAAWFTATVNAVAAGDWDNPAPPEGWVARDVVAHLTTWLPSFLASTTSVELPKGPGVAVDPVATWHIHSDGVQALLDDPSISDRSFDFPHIGTMRLGQAINQIYVPDVFLHRWDLARATGLNEHLDESICAAMYEGMLPLDQILRESGQYGPRVDVADDADAQTKLLAFIGRHP